jgi:hypothetical protein
MNPISTIRITRKKETPPGECKNCTRRNHLYGHRDFMGHRCQLLDIRKIPIPGNRTHRHLGMKDPDAGDTEPRARP